MNDNLSLSTDVACEQIRTFLRQMGQPIDKEVLNLILLNEQQLCERAVANSYVNATVTQSAAAGGGLAVRSGPGGESGQGDFGGSGKRKL